MKNIPPPPSPQNKMIKMHWENLIHLVNRLIKQVVNDFCNSSNNVDACENKYLITVQIN